MIPSFQANRVDPGQEQSDLGRRPWSDCSLHSVVDPDQTVGAVWSGSTLFAIQSASLDAFIISDSLVKSRG